MSDRDLCVACSSIVCPRQEALQCDNCSLWQHRTCDTGISRDFYRRLTKGQVELSDWNCKVCSVLATSEIREPTVESTRLSIDFTDIDFAVPQALDLTSIDQTYTVSQSIADNTDDEHFGYDKSSIADPVPNPVEESFVLTFDRVPSGTKRGKDKLVDSKGYTLRIRKKARAHL